MDANNRVGPRRQVASEQEERLLAERRASSAKTFDALPCAGSSIDDLAVELFLHGYCPKAFAPDILAQNHRDIRLKLASLRFYDLERDRPTHAGVIMFGRNPRQWLPGAYVQFVKFADDEMGGPVLAEQELKGDLTDQLRQLDLLLDFVILPRPVSVSTLRETSVVSYPRGAIRELLLNAVVHRDYNSTAPIRFYLFSEHIEIQNPGPLYGDATPENFRIKLRIGILSLPKQ